VSPRYAKEVAASAEKGAELQELLSSKVRISPEILVL